ncbi:carboxypeptidase regulatory-like domain-containing protein [bacterium]|nr:carboxypeptidase regulatory-like domain-containing protein [bacterium]
MTKIASAFWVFIISIILSLPCLNFADCNKTITEFDNTAGNRVTRNSTEAGLMNMFRNSRLPDSRRCSFYPESEMDFAAEIEWTLTHETSVVNDDALITKNGELIAIAFNLNVERFSLFNFYDPDPVWEYSTLSDCRMDIADIGNRVIASSRDTIYFMEADSSLPIWRYHVGAGYNAGAVDISGDGIYSVGSAISSDTIKILLFSSTPIPLWTKTIDPSVSGNLVGLEIPTNKSKLLVTCRYMIYVIDMFTTDIIWSTEAFNTECPADISGDESIIVAGSLTNGLLRAFQWNSDREDYTLIWDYNFTGGTSAWATAVAVSEDGSTIMAGSLIFLESGYSGEVACFETYGSGEPLWLYEGMGEEVSDIALSDDGLIGIVGSWGDIANTTPDIAVFETPFPEPFFTAISPGSINGVDISGDGKHAVAGGKAVHNRVFGNGAKVYAIEMNLGGGFISGRVNLSDTTDNSGVTVRTIDYPRNASTRSDGSYLLNYVPVGTYTVTASKLGYSTGSSAGVSVSELDTTFDIDFELDPVEAAPQNLVSSTGLLDSIELTWEPFEVRRTSTYSTLTIPDSIRIYRSLIPGGPYTFIGKVTGEDSIYIDYGVFPTYDYYYVVTAKYTEGESDYSNEAMGNLDDSYIVTDVEVPLAEVIPTFNGWFDMEEWGDAVKVDISDVFGIYDGEPNRPGTVFIYFKYSDSLDLLYIAAENKWDHALTPGEGLGIYIDDNHDGSWARSEDRWDEGNFWFNYVAGSIGIPIFRELVYGAREGYRDTLPDIPLKFSTGFGWFQMETALSLGFKEGTQLQLFAPDRKIGFGVFLQRIITGTGSTFDGWWPQDMDNIVSYPNHYGTLTIPAVLYAPPDKVDSIAVFSPGYRRLEVEWNDPETGVDGFPLLRLSGLILYRNGDSYAFIDSDVERFSDRELVQGAWYEYAIQGYTEIDYEIVMGTMSEYYGSFVGSAPELTEIAHTDSSAEGYYVVSFSWDNNKFAASFEPPFYPCMVRKVAVFSNNNMGIDITIQADSSGLPGTVTSGPFRMDLNSYTWTEYNLPGDEPPEVEHGIYWVVINFLEEYSGYPGIGVDYTAPIDSNCYSYTGTDGWNPFFFGDLMIKAWVSAPMAGIEDKPSTALPQRCELSQNYPNPFNSNTVIKFQVSPGGLKHLADNWVEIPVFNILGENVVTLEKEINAGGSYSITWDGRDKEGESLASGVYFYKLRVGEFEDCRRMLLMK